MSVTSATKITNFGPMLGLRFEDNSRVWTERGLAERIRPLLVPATPPKTVDVVGGCWVWVGPMSTDGRPYVPWKDEFVPVRRLLYTLKNGHLDARQHLTPACGVARCCNPDHQDTMAIGPVPKPPLTRTEANRYDRCAFGHVLSPSNVYEQQGRRYCRACRAANSRSYRLRQRADAARAERSRAQEKTGTGTPGRRRAG